MGPRTRPAPTDQAADISGKAKASPASERFGRLERGSARGGGDSGQEAEQHADAGSEQSPHDTHGRALNKELCCDVAASSANGTPQSDLRGPLHHTHQG